MAKPFSLQEFLILRPLCTCSRMPATLALALHLVGNGSLGNLSHYHISDREFLPIAIAFETWGSTFQNSSVVLHCDNSAVVQVINKTSCKDTNLMILMRRLMVLSPKNNILFSARHFTGVYNTAAHMLSRLQVTQFKMRFHYMDQDPTPVPQDSLRI